MTRAAKHEGSDIISNAEKEFVHRAQECLRGVAIMEWAPDEAVLSPDDVLVDWDNLPQDPHFRVRRVGARNQQRPVTEAEMDSRRRQYESYKRWAEHTVGIHESEFREQLAIVQKQSSDLRGVEGAPVWMKRSNMGALSHAVRRCRVLGLHAAVRAFVVQDKQFACFVTEVSQELDRLMQMEDSAVRTRIMDMSQPDRIRCDLNIPLERSKFNSYYRSGAWVIGFLRAWLLGHRSHP